MLKKSLLLLPLIAALSIAAAPASAANYHIVVPAPGKASSYAEIKLALSPATLPSGYVGAPYAGFNFNTALQITGDSSLDMSQVSYSGALPQGLTLTKEGSVVGTPTTAGTSSFQVLARYKTKSAVGTYAVEVAAESRLVERAGVRYWEDGTFAQSCRDYIQPAHPYVYTGATGDGVYRISPGGVEPFDARCDMTTDGGGWTVFQRRFSQALDFYRGHNDYVSGFGDPASEYWLGLEHIRVLADHGKMLRVDMTNKVGESRYASYSSFSLGVAPDYVLNVQGYSGSAGDSLMKYHNGMGFSTYDHDVDSYSINCAATARGAWWYSNCFESNLNGSYIPHYDRAYYGIAWSPWVGTTASLQETEMKIR